MKHLKALIKKWLKVKEPVEVKSAIVIRKEGLSFKRGEAMQEITRKLLTKLTESGYVTVKESEQDGLILLEGSIKIIKPEDYV